MKSDSNLWELRPGVKIDHDELESVAQIACALKSLSAYTTFVIEREECPEDLQRIARQRQLKVKPLDLTPKAVTPPPLPDLPAPFFDAPPDEEALAVDEEFPETLEVRESDMMTPEVSNIFPASSSFFSENFGKHALQGVIWSEILRPPVSMRR